MLDTIMIELEQLGDEKTKQKYIKDGADTELFGVKVGDLKKLVKAHKLNKNNQLAIELIETKNYDAMYLGFLIMEPRGIDVENFIRWIDYSEYYRIRIHSLAYGMAEHDEFRQFLDYTKERKDDLHQSIHYAILAGRVVIDPTFNNDLLLDVVTYIRDNINTQAYSDMNYTKYEMYGLLGYIGMQVASLSDLMIDYSKQIDKGLNIETNRRSVNNVGFISSCINHGTVGKKRKSARC